MTRGSSLLDHLSFLYGEQRAPGLLEQLNALMAAFRRRVRDPDRSGALDLLTERDVVLITYGDQVTEPGRAALSTLSDVLEEHVAGTITGLHLLPFFPYSSDDGFSVIDYTAVDPRLGTWADIERLSRHFRLMFDAVINHISARSRWFQEFKAGNPAFADHFITVEAGTDLSHVVRPRALPLLTPVDTAQGRKLVWTTFSPDQIDLNYAHPEVLLKILKILLFYVEKGAEIIRLDAIAYLWKKIGTPCIHLEETHRVVKLFRAVLDRVAPHVILITETNVPHEENVSYFGNGHDEAQMVYQFSLPPLVLHTFRSQDATRLSEWAAGLTTPSQTATFFNFLASHDGIGVRPVEGILTPYEIQGLVDRTLAHGGHVSHRTNADGSRSVYELNISYFDALSDPNGGEPLDLQVQRFLASQAIMLSLQGVPGIYVHSLFGSRSHHAGVEETGHYRSINREKFRRHELEDALADPTTIRHRVFYPYLHLIRTRTAHTAFHPRADQRILSSPPALFTVLRTAPEGGERVLCVHNVSNTVQPCRIEAGFGTEQALDLIGTRVFDVAPGGVIELDLAPYQVMWLTERRSAAE
jgi:sucrose phosphorylase